MRLRLGRLLASATMLGAAVATARSAQAQTGLAVPQGFHVSVFAQGLSTLTAIAIGPDRRLNVAEEGGSILVIGGGGTRTIATVYGVPLGLAWHAGKLYVSSTGRVTVLSPGRGYSSFSGRVIVAGLPTGKHQNDGMAFQGPWMYLGIGSTCNACTETDRRSATIMRFRDNGSGGQVYARGLRNPYGLAIRPTSKRLYATDNGRDDFDDQVPDELDRIVRGGNYGWPSCWGNGGGSGCRGTVAPVALFEPHASADGIVFYTGGTFPARYRGDAFVAEFGQTVGSGYHGHKLVDVHFTGRKVTVTDFGTGFANPLALAVAPDSSLLVADFGTGTVWRVQANGH